MKHRFTRIQKLETPPITDYLQLANGTEKNLNFVYIERSTAAPPTTRGRIRNKRPVDNIHSNAIIYKNDKPCGGGV